MNSACWLYSGTLTQDGYGREVGDEVAHRYSYRTYIGEIPEGMFVCHRCDNPSCVRPDHLFLGTPKDNVQDMMRKKRNKFKSFPGELHWKHKLSDEEVQFIRNTRISARKYAVKATELAKRFNTTAKYIHKIRAGHGWEAKDG